MGIIVKKKAKETEISPLEVVKSKFTKEFDPKLLTLAGLRPTKEKFTNLFITKRGLLIKKINMMDFRDNMNLIDLDILKKAGADLDSVVLTTFGQFVEMSGYKVESELDVKSLNEANLKFQESQNDFWKEIAICLGKEYNPDWSEDKSVDFIYTLRKFADMNRDLYGLEILYKEVASYYRGIK